MDDILKIEVTFDSKIENTTTHQKKTKNTCLDCVNKIVNIENIPRKKICLESSHLTRGVLPMLPFLQQLEDTDIISDKLKYPNNVSLSIVYIEEDIVRR